MTTTDPAVSPHVQPVWWRGDGGWDGGRFPCTLVFSAAWNSGFTVHTCCTCRVSCIDVKMFPHNASLRWRCRVIEDYSLCSCAPCRKCLSTGWAKKMGPPWSF